jgi:5-methylcytosine-specific restriction endonuclease McrA
MNRRWVKAIKHPEEPLYRDRSVMKVRLAEQAGHRCVYCGIHVLRNGSDANFEIEHFRPESVMTEEEIAAGEHLNPYNLLYACAQCNRIKGDDWPGEPDVLTAPVHVNPSRHDYHDLMQIDSKTWEVQSHLTAGTYIVIRLGLNRDQLVQDRRIDHVMNELQDAIARIKTILQPNSPGGDITKDGPSIRVLVELLMQLIDILGRLMGQSLLSTP